MGKEMRDRMGTEGLIKARSGYRSRIRMGQFVIQLKYNFLIHFLKIFYVNTAFTSFAKPSLPPSTPVFHPLKLIISSLILYMCVCMSTYYLYVYYIYVIYVCITYIHVCINTACQSIQCCLHVYLQSQPLRIV